MRVFAVATPKLRPKLVEARTKLTAFLAQLRMNPGGEETPFRP